MDVPFYYWIHEQPYDYYRYTKYALSRFAERADMKVILLKSSGGSPEIVADFLAKNLTKIPFVGNALSVIIQMITAGFLKTRMGKKISEKTGEHFPLGYFLVAEKISRDASEN